MRHCREKGYKVTYWYLDNETLEPGHHQLHLQRQHLRGRMPSLWTSHQEGIPRRPTDLQPNPGSADSGVIKTFLQTAGKGVDYVDMHWYWEWGTSSFDKWVDRPPSYGETITRIRDVCRESGYPGIGVVALEYNVAPSDSNVSFSPALFAVIQAISCWIFSLTMCN
jgi:alpha-N-arabinofuranosidase